MFYAFFSVTDVPVLTCKTISVLHELRILAQLTQPDTITEMTRKVPTWMDFSVLFCLFGGFVYFFSSTHKNSVDNWKYQIEERHEK